MEAAQELEAESRAMRIADMATAAQGNGKSIDAAIRRLEGGKG